MVVDSIEIILHGILCGILPFSLQNILLGDLNDDLLDHGVGHVGGHGLQDERLPASEFHSSQPGSGNLSEEDGPENIHQLVDCLEKLSLIAIERFSVTTSQC